jgi:predicted ATPase
MLFDEPETSLHPHAISVFAQAVKLAAKEFNRQIVIATHSPVLMSQFAVDETLVFQAGEDRDTQAVRLADMAELSDLLDKYAIGSLYMAEEIARQSIAE